MISITLVYPVYWKASLSLKAGSADHPALKQQWKTIEKMEINLSFETEEQEVTTIDILS